MSEPQSQPQPPPQAGQPQYNQPQPGQPYGPSYSYGPPQQQPMSPSDERLWGMLAYLLSILAGLIAPLVIYLVYKDRGPFVRDTAKEALNFHITAAIVALAGVIGMMFVGVITTIIFPPAGALFFIVMWLLLIGYSVAVLIFNIIGAMRANSGVLYRVPCILRLVK